MCGVFGIANHEDAVRTAARGLFALQHRGQESAGLASETDIYTGMGLIDDVLNDEILTRFSGRTVIGHTRYSTAGDSSCNNAQPIMLKTKYGVIKMGHNGNLTNARTLRRDLENQGAEFITTSDSEVILHLVDRSGESNFQDALASALGKIQGAFSLVIIKDDGLLVGVRDPNGFRPLVLGRLGSSWVLASEPCALNMIGAIYIREVQPGQALWITGPERPTSIWFGKLGQPGQDKTTKCLFEHVYFSHPGSVVFGVQERLARETMGKILAKECPANAADIVVGVPDSGMDAAWGFHLESGIPFAFGLVRNHYMGRTFIDHERQTRFNKVTLKLMPIPEIFRGKRVVLIDDSIVRGTTSQVIVQMVEAAGAAETHMRISSPPILSPCFYGIDTPTWEELIAFRMKKQIEQIAKYLGVKSLGYLSLPGLLRAVGAKPNEYCDACFTGNYPTKLVDLEANLVEQRP